MVWKLGSNPAQEQPGSEWAAPISNELLDQVMRGKLRSTYQSDFLGVPQGVLSLLFRNVDRCIIFSSSMYDRSASTPRMLELILVTCSERWTDVDYYVCNGN